MAQVSISAEVSGGTVNILHPLEIVRQIRKIAQNPIVATEVEAVFISHPSVEVKGPRMSPVSLCALVWLHMLLEMCYVYVMQIVWCCVCLCIEYAHYAVCHSCTTFDVFESFPIHAIRW